MNNMNSIRTLAAALVVLLTGSIALTACSNEESTATPSVKEGIVFNFKRKIIYAASGVNEIGSVKITVSDGTKRIALPSSPLTGDEAMASTVPFALPAGNYEITGYKAFDKRQNSLFEIELDSLNEFMVERGAVSSFVVPVKSRDVFNQNVVRNSLLGICKEVFGSDESTWPWDPEKYPYPDWEGLEFEFDDYNNPMFISGIYFDGFRDGKETPWAKMTAIPDGTLTNLATIGNITVTNIPGFKHLPDDLNRFPALGVITIVDCGLEELPGNLHQITSLNSLSVVRCQLKEVPAGVAELTDLRMLHLRGNQISKIDLPLTKLKKLESIDFAENPLQSIGEGVLAADGKLIELVVSGTKLSSLPSDIARMTYLRGVQLQNCQFTSVPAPVKGNTGIKGLYLDGNPISSLSNNDLVNMSELETLTLKNVQLGSLPRLTLSKLIWLDITGCGLTSAPDLSALPELRAMYLGNNKLTTLPVDYFKSNPKMRILSLANTATLTSMPAGNLGLVSRISDKIEGFTYLDVSDCPALRWTTPAAWQCFDDTSKPYESKTRRPEFDPGEPTNPYFGRVAVKRTNSTGVTFGK